MSNITTIEEKVDNRASLKEQIEVLEKRLKALNAEILADLTEAGLKDITTPLGNHVTVINQPITDINVDLLQSRLTPAQWNKVTTRVLSKPLLEAQVTIGKIDAAIVEECKFVKIAKRFLR